MSTQPNVISDISTLTRVPNKVLTELAHKTNLCIGNIISEAKEAGEQAVIINIGIGTLSIDLIDMQCKFVPSKELKATIKTSLSSKKDLLEFELEKTLIDKLLAICDEVV
jgi:MoaA/NifB/PqqE/SkfB family radical SAM enzyme